MATIVKALSNPMDNALAFVKAMNIAAATRAQGLRNKRDKMELGYLQESMKTRQEVQKADAAYADARSRKAEVEAIVAEETRQSQITAGHNRALGGGRDGGGGIAKGLARGRVERNKRLKPDKFGSYGSADEPFVSRDMLNFSELSAIVTDSTGLKQGTGDHVRMVGLLDERVKRGMREVEDESLKNAAMKARIIQGVDPVILKELLGEQSPITQAAIRYASERADARTDVQKQSRKLQVDAAFARLKDIDSEGLSVEGDRKIIADGGAAARPAEGRMAVRREVGALFRKFNIDHPYAQLGQQLGGVNQPRTEQSPAAVDSENNPTRAPANQKPAVQRVQIDKEIYLTVAKMDDDDLRNFPSMSRSEQLVFIGGIATLLQASTGASIQPGRVRKIIERRLKEIGTAKNPAQVRGREAERAAEERGRIRREEFEADILRNKNRARKRKGLPPINADGSVDIEDLVGQLDSRNP